MCKPRVNPMVLIIVAEFDATSRLSTRMFHTFVVGKIEQFEAPGTVGPDGPVRRGNGTGPTWGRGAATGAPPRGSALRTGSAKASTRQSAAANARRTAITKLS